MDLVSVAEAAEKLGVSERHVRRLTAAGELHGRRIGDRWLIDADAVRHRSRSEPQPGRPLSTRMAWAVLAAADSALEAESSRRPAPIEDRRIRHRLRKLLAEAPPPERWDQWLRHRADPQRVWVHPGVVDRLAEDDRLHPGGARAVAASGVGIAGGSGHSFYIDENVVGSVLADYRAHPAADGQVVLMVVPADVPEMVIGRPGEPVIPAAALVDLLGSSDARERYVAAAALEAARHKLVSAPMGDSLPS